MLSAYSRIACKTSPAARYRTQSHGHGCTAFQTDRVHNALLPRDRTSSYPLHSSWSKPKSRKVVSTKFGTLAWQVNVPVNDGTLEDLEIERLQVVIVVSTIPVAQSLRARSQRFLFPTSRSRFALRHQPK